MQTLQIRPACLCGKMEGSSVGEKDGVELIQCHCGIIRPAELDEQDYIAQYMSGYYHEENNATVVDAVIADRFKHDYEVGMARLRELDMVTVIAPERRLTILDVGCGNGSFVQAALDAGHDAWGIDLYLPPIAYEVRTRSFAELESRVDQTTLADCRFGRRMVDVIFMSDVIEHLADLKTVMQQAASIVKRSGLIVVDTPEFEEPFDIENHHVKPLEHIWYATPRLWEELFAELDLQTVAVRRPISGKIVFYLRPNPETVLDVIVRGPTGLGDVHWILLKMRSLKASEAPCKLTLAIPGNGDPKMIFRAKGFLEMLPFLDHCKMEIGSPVIVDSWSDDVRKPEYTWIANGHLERGLRIEDWNPHLTVDYDYPIDIPDTATEWAKSIHELVGEQLVVLYASSQAWNYSITGGDSWTVDSWAELLERFRDGVKPVLIGKEWDKDYSTQFAQAVKAPYLDLIGQTDEAMALALMKESQAVIGMCAGITILAVHLKARSILFWPERGKGNQKTPMLFHKHFADDWVDRKQLEERTYVPLSLGDFDVDTVCGHLKRWGVL